MVFLVQQAKDSSPCEMRGICRIFETYGDQTQKFGYTGVKSLIPVAHQRQRTVGVLGGLAHVG